MIGRGAQMTGSELDEIVGELYLLPPTEFVAARNELARQARAAGNREFAETLQNLRRPTRSAWLVNRLARQDSEAMKRLSTVGRELREAQTGLDGAQLRNLAEQRRQVIDELLERARHRAHEAGLRLTNAMMSEVEATLQAALVDLSGSLTVRNGRLERPLSKSGFGPQPHVDIATTAESAREETDEYAPPVEDELAARRHARAAGGGVRIAAVDEPATSAGNTEALRELREAEQELAAAESLHWQREFELADAAAGVEAANDRLNSLDSQRMEARREKVSAEAHLAEARTRQLEAVRAVEHARRRLDLARQWAGMDDER
jgi:hypothetical protein